MSPAPKPVKRYPVNPVEALILGIMGLVFATSAYNLVNDARNPMADAGRNPASTGPTYLNLEVPCPNGVPGAEAALGSGTASTKTTQASKIRLVGTLCGIPEGTASQGLKTEIANESNRANATVFTDLSQKRYSTDYIQLNKGENAISVKITYPNGKTSSQSVRVNRE